MDIDFENLNIRNNPQASRYEVQLGDQLAIAEYSLAGGNMIFTHTEVPVEFEGKGIASHLAKFALDDAIASGYKIQALCPYITVYVQRHKEYQPHTWGYF